MTRLVWTPSTDVDLGISHSVLYPKTESGIAWSGVTGVSEVREGFESKPYYIDGFKAKNHSTPGNFEFNITAYTYPDLLEKYLPSMDWDEYAEFDFIYRVRTFDEGYKIHLVYNCSIAKEAFLFASQNSSAEASVFSWLVKTRPVKLENFRPAAHLILDSREVLPENLLALENKLYGTELTDPLMPDIQELLELFAATSLVVLDHGDGTWSVTGPDDMVTLDGDAFTIRSPSLQYLDPSQYRVSSY